MLIMVNTQQDGPIIGYMRISNAPLVRRHGGNLDPIWPPPPSSSSLPGTRKITEFYKNSVIFLVPGTYVI